MGLRRTIKLALIGRINNSIKKSETIKQNSIHCLFLNIFVARHERIFVIKKIPTKKGGSPAFSSLPPLNFAKGACLISLCPSRGTRPSSRGLARPRGRRPPFAYHGGPSGAPILQSWSSLGSSPMPSSPWLGRPIGSLRR